MLGVREEFLEGLADTGVTAKKVLWHLGRGKEHNETWWWNEEVQESIQRKRSVKRWDSRREESRQEYKEMQCKAKREVVKSREKTYGE